MMYLLDQFTDSGGQRQWSLGDVFLDGVRCFVGCEVETRVLLLFLFLHSKRAEADREDAEDAVVAGFEGWAWRELVVDDIVG